MVLFGELVIPSSRILWDDDEETEQFESDTEIYKWQGNATIPTKITNLLIVETTKLTTLARTCLEQNAEPKCKLLEANVSIFELSPGSYLILCEDAKEVIPGEVTEKLAPFLQNAVKIINITSNSVAMFQKSTAMDMPISFVRSLTCGDVGSAFAPRLEAPNLITGVTAGVFSYCQHMEMPASLYVCYFDSRPLDSTTAEPILQLLKKFEIPTPIQFSFKSQYKVDSNLYM